MATKKAKPKKLSVEELARELYAAYRNGGYRAGYLWRHLAEVVRRLAREGKL